MQDSSIHTRSLSFAAAWASLAISLASPAGSLAKPPAAADFSEVNLAWRGDPRPAAAGDAVPMTRRAARRARRAARRTPAAVEPALEPAVPIRVRSTLDSPFHAEPERVIVHRSIVYAGADETRSLDLYLPRVCRGGLPLVAWFAGERWSDPQRSPCPIAWLAEDGFAVACIGYRPGGQASHPAQFEDAAAAIDYLARNAELWGIDRGLIVVAGRAAGGHLAALLATDELQGERLAGACVIESPTMLTALGGRHDRPGSEASRLVGGPLPEFREAALRASPAARVPRNPPPFLILHGASQPATPLDQSRRLDAAVRQAGGESRLLLLPSAATTGRQSDAGAALIDFLQGIIEPESTAGKPAAGDALLYPASTTPPAPSAVTQ